MQNNNDEISLKDLITKGKEITIYLLKKWKFLFAIGLLSAILGLCYSLYKKPIYVATLTFSVIEKSSSGGLSSLAGQFGLNLGGSSEGVFSSANILELLKSRYLIENALLSKISLSNETLIDYYSSLKKKEDKNSEGDDISFPLGQNRNTFTRTQDSILSLRVNSLTIKNLIISKPKKDASIIQIQFKNSDELFAKEFVENLINVTGDFYIESKTKTLAYNIALMENKADSLRQEYETKLVGKARYADHNINPARQIASVEQQKYMTDIQILGTAYAEVVKNIEIMKMDLARETPLIQIIDRPIMPLKKERLGKMKAMVLGGFLGGFLSIAYFLMLYFYRQIMKED